MADLSVNICGVKFKNPVIAASGTYGFGREYNELYDISMIGGISTKGMTLEPRLGNPVPRIAEGTSVILNAVGLQNPGVEHFIKYDLPFLREKGIVIIAGKVPSPGHSLPALFHLQVGKTVGRRSCNLQKSIFLGGIYNTVTHNFG